MNSRLEREPGIVVHSGDGCCKTVLRALFHSAAKGPTVTLRSLIAVTARCAITGCPAAPQSCSEVFHVRSIAL